MPYASEKQRRFMYSQHPDIAKKWDAEGENRIEPKQKADVKSQVIARSKRRKSS